MGILSLQLCANHNDVLLNALLDIQAHTKGAMRLRWSIDGFRPPPRPSGTPRDQLGFHDDVADHFIRDAKNGYDQFVWVHPGAPEPAWTVGGTYQVIRIVQFDLAAWDRVPEAEQEKIIGRHKVSGIPLNGGTNEDSPVVYDPAGKVIPFNCHIRLANPKNGSGTCRPHLASQLPVHPRPTCRMDNWTPGTPSAATRASSAPIIDMQQRLENEMLVPYPQPDRWRLLLRTARCGQRARLLRPQAC